VVPPPERSVPGSSVPRPSGSGSSVAAPVSTAEPTAEPAPSAPGGGAGVFEVHLSNFTGPFDLLLSLIAKHKLDVTEVALATVTDEFVSHIRDAAEEWNLDTASEFLVIAATLLDLKAARLLPTNDSEDPEDIELLEARDLLFARLLQYRAYKEIAGQIVERLDVQGRYTPRSVSLEPQLAALLPDLVWSIGPEELAVIAAQTLAPRPPPAGVSLDHLHAPAVSVREQAAIVVERLRRDGQSTFRALVADAETPLIVVGRFLALLELYRESAILFEQLAPLGELTVRWSGKDDDGVQIHTDYDDGDRDDGDQRVDRGTDQATDEATDDGGTEDE